MILDVLLTVCIVSFAAMVLGMVISELNGGTPLMDAYSWPGRFDVADASAIQMTQIYTMASYYALRAVAALATGIAALAAACAMREERGV